MDKGFLSSKRQNINTSDGVVNTIGDYFQGLVGVGGGEYGRAHITERNQFVADSHCRSRYETLFAKRHLYEINCNGVVKQLE